MKYFFSLLFLLCLYSNTHSAYIDQRDLSNEILTIQRLIGRLETLQTYVDNSASSKTTATILSLATAGLILAAVNTDTYYYHKSNFNDPSLWSTHHYHQDKVGKNIRISGVIISDNTKEANAKKTQEITKTQKKINTIISNLIVTDIDYTAEKEVLHKYLTSHTDKKILDLSTKVSNDIQILKKSEQDKLFQFNRLTNKLLTSIAIAEADIAKYISYNIEKMNKSNTSSDSIKELKKLNTDLKKQKSRKIKELQKQVKNSVNQFHKTFPKLQKETFETITHLEEFRDQQILASIKEATKEENNLFQKFKALYIKKLTAY